jgi:hypothetical protein
MPFICCFISSSAAARAERVSPCRPQISSHLLLGLPGSVLPSVDDIEIACFNYKWKNEMPGTAVKLVIYFRDISGSNLSEGSGY